MFAILGRDADQAAQVSAALACLQRPRRLARELSSRLAEVRKDMHAMKECLQSHAASRGFLYHGYTARRQRPPAPTDMTEHPKLLH